MQLLHLHLSCSHFNTHTHTTHAHHTHTPHTHTPHTHTPHTHTTHTYMDSIFRRLRRLTMSKLCKTLSSSSPSSRLALMSTSPSAGNGVLAAWGRSVMQYSPIDLEQ